MLKLYSYYRSSASYRVRIALNYKKLEYKIIPVDLNSGEHYSTEYQIVNKQGRIPTLVDNDFEVGQSSAILEYLEEKYPEPELLPHDIKARAWVRYLAQIIISDIHPLNNSGVIKFLRTSMEMDSAQIIFWYHNWIKRGFDALEKMLYNHPNRKNFCWNNRPTLADVCLIPQIYNAYLVNFPMDNYPTLRSINEYCLSLPYFNKAKPENQLDYKEERNKMDMR